MLQEWMEKMRKRNGCSMETVQGKLMPSVSTPLCSEKEKKPFRISLSKVF
jgi:hypothetical protein